MADDSVKLTYLASKFQVKLEIPTESCQTIDAPPSDLLERAIKKMDSVLANGEIIDYVIHQNILDEVWTQSKKSPTPGKIINIILAEGFPKLPGLEVKIINDGKTLAKISINASAYTISQWRIQWIWLFIENELKKSGNKTKVNRSNIMNAWLQGLTGQEVHQASIGPFPSSILNADSVEKKGYEISASNVKKEISLTIWDYKKFIKGHSLEQIIALVESTCKKMQDKTGVTYNSLAKDVITVLQNASNGPETLGINLPIHLLAGTNLSILPGNYQRKPYPGCGKLDIRVSETGLDASIMAVNGDLYDGTFAITEEWLKLEIQRHGINLLYTEEQQKKFFEKAMKRQSIIGLTIAQGIPSQPGSTPTLVALEGADFAEDGNVNLDLDTIDIRESQQRSIVKVGQPIATVSFKTKPEPGKDVYGRNIPNVWTEADLPFELEGVERKGLKFISLKSGCVFLTEKSLAVKEIVIHKGNVNLTSGNISFDGPVEIEGIVEVGAIVKAKGLLVIKGSVMGGYLHCYGNIQISGGINTGESGVIIATGDLDVDFIENSDVRVGGNIRANKAILNSNIISGKAIIITSREGMIGGGNLNCKEYIKTANLGFINGNITRLNVGTDWKIENRFRSLEKREKRFNQIQEEDRQTLREIISRKKSTGVMLPKDLKLKEMFQERLIKQRRILDKIKETLAKAKSSLSYNAQAKVFVFKKLVANVEAIVGGTPVVIKQDLSEVALVANKNKDTKRIVPVQVVVDLERMKGEEGIKMD